MRGLDYYTGTVFELFDLNPTNNRAMSGGGRYEDLVELFIDEKIPGVGFGMGDVTLTEFLKSWQLLPDLKSQIDYFVTIWPNEEETYFKASLEVTNILRSRGKNTIMWLEKDTKLDKQLKFADKKLASKVIIIGEQELKEGKVTIKDLQNRSQETKTLDVFFKELT
jgi:histidyl-tRNA synthetase